MSLHTLPPELLHEILQYLGPAFFRNNLGCLTLYKAWYTVARPIYLRELYLCHHRFRSFWAHPKVEAHLAVIKEHVRDIHLMVGCPGFLDEEPLTEATGKAAKNIVNRLARQPEESPLKRWAQGSTTLQDDTYWLWRGLVQAEQWRNRERLNTDMARLAQALRGGKRIESLCLNAVYSGGAFPPSTHALDYTTIRAFLILDTYLTSLDLTVIDRPGIDGPAHICPMIRKHLRTLRSLRLHVSPICHKVLELEEPKLKRIPLREVIIRLDLWNNRKPEDCHIAPVSGCSSAISGVLQDLMESRVGKLVPLMEHGKVACVLSARGRIGGRGYSRVLYDALDGTHIKISSVPNSELLCKDAKEALEKNRICLNSEVAEAAAPTQPLVKNTRAS